MLIVDQDYDFAQQFLSPRISEKLSVDIVDIECNPSVGLEKFHLLKPDILLLGDIYFHMDVQVFLTAIEHLSNQFFVVCMTAEPLRFSIEEHPRIAEALIKTHTSADLSILRQALEHICALMRSEAPQEMVVSDAHDYSEQKNRCLCRLLHKHDKEYPLSALKALGLDIACESFYLLLCRPGAQQIHSVVNISLLYDDIKGLLSAYRGGELFATESGDIFILCNAFLHKSAEQFQPNIIAFNSLVERISILVQTRLGQGYHVILSERIQTLQMIPEWAERLSACYKYVYFTWQTKLLYYKKIPDALPLPACQRIELHAEKLLRCLLHADALGAGRTVSDRAEACLQLPSAFVCPGTASESSFDLLPVTQISRKAAI